MCGVRAVRASVYRRLEILGKRCTVEEVMKEVRKDASFYRTSGGGVTVSGGEPLMQPDFTYELLSALKRRGCIPALKPPATGLCKQF